MDSEADSVGPNAVSRIGEAAVSHRGVIVHTLETTVWADELTIGALSLHDHLHAQALVHQLRQERGNISIKNELCFE